jgi:hypothetical protein
MADRKGQNSKIIPLGQTQGPYGNDPYIKGSVREQNKTPLKP